MKQKIPTKETIKYISKSADDFTVKDWNSMSEEERKPYLPLKS
jgi:hypothetical protein